MANKGATPLDPAAPLGRLRALLRDTEHQPLTPAEPGFADYAEFSDMDLQAFLIEAGDNVLRAAGRATTSLALAYSAEGKSIKTDDLAIDLRSRGKDLLEVARSFMQDAAAEDAAGAADFFEIVSIGRGQLPPSRVGSPWDFI